MSLPARICVARHGETDWNTAGILQGWLDVPMNARGREQARAFAAAFAGHGFSRIYSSPLRRALENAEILAEQWGLAPPICDEGLKERNFGVIQGIPKAELAELNPALLEKILKRNPAAEFEQGESMDEVATRVQDAIMTIGADNAGKCVLVVTHGWVLDVITRLVNGLPRHAILHVKPKNSECLWLEATRESMRPLRTTGVV